jgi:NAD-dependent deacetylase
MMDIKPINPADYQAIVFFTGAGMSAESGVPTYRGKGGIWSEYRWEELACEEAFRKDPEKRPWKHPIRTSLSSLRTLTGCTSGPAHNA